MARRYRRISLVGANIGWNRTHSADQGRHLPKPVTGQRPALPPATTDASPWEVPTLVGTKSTAPTRVGIYQNRLPASGRRYPLQQPPHRLGRCQPWLARTHSADRGRHLPKPVAGQRPALPPATTDASPWKVPTLVGTKSTAPTRVGIYQNRLPASGRHYPCSNRRCNRSTARCSSTRLRPSFIHCGRRENIEPLVTPARSRRGAAA